MLAKMLQFGNQRRAIIAAAFAISALGSATAKAQESAQFDSPEAAVNALVDACSAKNREELRHIFGPTSKELLSGDEVADQAALEGFAERLRSRHELQANDDGSQTLLIGANAHPFAIPLVQKNGKWFFDTEAGKDELLNRRIGENELDTIAVCRAYVVAQREYFLQDQDGDEVLEYAQRLASTPGAHDGLFWETEDGEDLSPLGPMVAQARAEGYGARKKSSDEQDSGPRPYHGYVYKILNSQSGESPGGAFDYVINGNMVAGFGLAAYPVDYGHSGIMTFIVNANGVVFQKDLGEDTANAAAKMSAYERDSSWSPVED